MQISSNDVGLVTGLAMTFTGSAALAVQPDAVSRLDGYHITEFTPESRPDMTCVTSYYGSRLAMDCFRKSAAAEADAPTLDADYRLDSYQITEFTPKTAPDMTCVTAYYSSHFGMDCFNKSAEPPGREHLDATYRTDGYQITEFTPKTAPDSTCIISYYGSRSDITCTPR